MDYSLNIRKIRERKGFSQDYVASKLDLSQRAYSKIENGETNLSVTKLFEISKVLETEISELLALDGKHVYNNVVHNQKGGNNCVINQNDKIEELTNRLLAEKDEVIKIKDEVIASLRQQIEIVLRSK